MKFLRTAENRYFGFQLGNQVCAKVIFKKIMGHGKVAHSNVAIPEVLDELNGLTVLPKMLL